MVTHDMGLKYFSDRVIWMRDGKIQRVEIVNEEKKQATFEQLYKDMDALTNANKSDGKNKGKKQVKVRTPSHYSHLTQGNKGRENDLEKMKTGFNLDFLQK